MRSSSLILIALVVVFAMLAAQPAVAQLFCGLKEISLTDSNGLHPVFSAHNPRFGSRKFTLQVDLPYSPVQVNMKLVDTSLSVGYVITSFGTPPVLLSNVSVQDVESRPPSAPFLTQCGTVNAVRVETYSTTTFPADPPEFEGIQLPPSVVSCNLTYGFFFTNKACGVRGDPQFSGLRGQSFQVHGIDGAVYSLISAPSYLVNSRFEFLDGPRSCPVMPTTGRKSTACWSHPGSYLGAVAVRTVAGDVLLIESGSASTGFSSVTLNGKAMAVSDVASLASSMGSVSVNSTHEMTVSVGDFQIEVENIDGFVNLRSVRVSTEGLQRLRDQHVHGLLGQTWQSRRFGGSVKEIEGEVDDYVISEQTLTGSSFVFNRFRLTA